MKLAPGQSHGAYNRDNPALLLPTPATFLKSLFGPLDLGIRVRRFSRLSRAARQLQCHALPREFTLFTAGMPSGFTIDDARDDVQGRQHDRRFALTRAGHLHFIRPSTGI